LQAKCAGRAGPSLARRRNGPVDLFFPDRQLVSAALRAAGLVLRRFLCFGTDGLLDGVLHA
jgi:hypothetical protein